MTCISSLTPTTTLQSQEVSAGLLTTQTQSSDFKSTKTQWTTRLPARHTWNQSQIQFRSLLVNTQPEILSILQFSTIGLVYMTGELILSLTTQCMFTPSRISLLRIPKEIPTCGTWMASIQVTLRALTIDKTPLTGLPSSNPDPSLMFGMLQTTLHSSRILYSTISG